MSDTSVSGDETLHARLDTGERRLAVLLEQSQRLMAECDPGALLQRVAAAAREITRARIASVGIVSDEGRFEDLVSVGLEDDVVAEMRRQLAMDARHPARRATERREVGCGTNPGGDPRSLCLPASHPPVRSFLFVPIASPSRVYGWLGIVEKIGAKAFSDVDTMLARTFGSQAGIVFENAQLMSRLQAQADAFREQE